MQCRVHKAESWCGYQDGVLHGGRVTVEGRVMCWPLGTRHMVTYRSLKGGDKLALDPGTTVLEWEAQAQR